MSTLASLSTGSTPIDFGYRIPTWPVGLRFDPTEEELVNHYLRGKLKGEVEAFRLIPELYIYMCEPPDLFIRYNELSDIPSDGRECFFFCPPEDKIPNNRRSNNRKTEFGYWKETSKERKIQGKQIGIRKIFVYYEGQQRKGRKTDIVMHQYHLNSEVSASKVSGPMAFVLCHIIKRKPKKTRSAKASTSASSSPSSSPNDSGNGRAPEINAQASEEATIQMENPTEMSISSMPGSNAPSIPQQAQMHEEQSSLHNGYQFEDGHIDEYFATPYSPGFIEISDLCNFENPTEMSISSMPESNAPSIPQQAQMQEEQSLLHNGYRFEDGHSDEYYATPYSPGFIEILDLCNFENPTEMSISSMLDSNAPSISSAGPDARVAKLAS